MNLFHYIRRRSLLNGQILFALSLGVILAVVLIASGPLIVDTVLDINLQRRLNVLGPGGSNLRIQFTAAADGEAFAQFDGELSEQLHNRLGSYVKGIVASGSTAWAYPWEGGELRIDPRVNLRFYDTDESRLLTNLSWSSGDWPTGRMEDPAVIPVVMGTAAATAFGLTPGERLPVSVRPEAEAPDFWVSVSGVLDPVDEDSAYWGSLSPTRNLPDVRHSAQYNLLVSEETFFEAAARFFSASRVDMAWEVIFDLGSIRVNDAAGVLIQIQALEADLASRGGNIQFQTEMTDVLADTAPGSEEVRAPLYFLLAAVILVSLYYVLMVATLSVRQSKREFAVLRSRGSSSVQLLSLQIVEAAVISGVAIISGPLLARWGNRLLFLTGPLSDLVGADWAFHLSVASWSAAAIGALACFVGLLGPVPGAVRSSIVAHAGGLSRTEVKPWWQRYYLDVFLMVIGLILLWRLRTYGGILGEGEVGQRIDWLLLLSPLALLLGGATITLRVFPPLLDLGAQIMSRARGLPAALAFMQSARDPVHVARLVLLLTLATALGILSRGLNTALDQNERDRARYAVGSDLRLIGTGSGGLGILEIDQAGEGIAQLVPAVRGSGSLQMTVANAHPEFDLLGIAPVAFGEVTSLRPDYASTPILDLLDQLTHTQPQENPPIPLSGKPSQFGAWVFLPFSGVSTLSAFTAVNGADIDDVLITAKFHTALGELFSLPLRADTEVEGRSPGWVFFSTDLPRFGEVSYPLDLVALWFNKRENFNFNYTILPKLALDDLTIVTDEGIRENLVFEDFDAGDLKWGTNDSRLRLTLEGVFPTGEHPSPTEGRQLLLDFGWGGLEGSEWLPLIPGQFSGEELVEFTPEEQSDFEIEIPTTATAIRLWVSAAIRGEYRTGGEVIRIGQLEDLIVRFGIKNAQGEALQFDSSPAVFNAEDNPVTVKPWGFFQLEFPDLPEESFPLEMTSIEFEHTDGARFPVLELDDLTMVDPEGETIIASFDGDQPPYWRAESEYQGWIFSGPAQGFARTFTRIWTMSGIGVEDPGVIHLLPKAEPLVFPEFEGAEESQEPESSLGVLPALVSPQFMAVTQVGLGERVGAWIDSRPFQLEVIGTVDYFPTLQDERQAGFVVINQEDLLLPVNAFGPESHNANEYFISLEPADTSSAGDSTASVIRSNIIRATVGEELEMLDAEELRKTIKSDPLALGLRSITTLGYWLTSVLSLVGFGSYFYVSVRQRRKNFAVLRAMGMSARQMYGSLMLEQLMLILSGLGVGTGLGLLLNQLTLPGLPLSLGGQPPVPPFIATTDWVGVARIALTLTIAFLIMLALATISLNRTELHRILRVDEE